MTTTYYVAISLADSLYRSTTNQHGWVPGFDTDPANWLQANAQPFADAGVPILFHNAWGRGGTGRSFSKRFDGKDTVPTQAEWLLDDENQSYALSNFVNSPGIDRTILYVGSPDTHMNATLRYAARRLELVAAYFPRTSIIYDNVGDAKTDEHTPASAMFAAHDAMDRQPFNSPVPWGIEPNPARKNWNLPAKYYTSICYTYGTPRTWSAVERYSIEHVANSEQIPIVAIRGDEFLTAEERIAAAKHWGPRVAPYNGIVVVHGVSVQQMEKIKESAK